MTLRFVFRRALRKISGRAAVSLLLLSVLAPAAPAQATHTAQDWAQLPAASATQDSLRDYLTRLRIALLAANERPDQTQPLTLRARAIAESRSGVRRLQIRNFQFLSDGSRLTAEYNLGPGARSCAGRIARTPDRPAATRPRSSLGVDRVQPFSKRLLRKQISSGLPEGSSK